VTASSSSFFGWETEPEQRQNETPGTEEPVVIA